MRVQRSVYLNDSSSENSCSWTAGEAPTFQDPGLLGDADLSLGDNGFALGVADVSWDEVEAGLLLLGGAREVERQQLPVRQLKSYAHV